MKKPAKQRKIKKLNKARKHKKLSKSADSKWISSTTSSPILPGLGKTSIELMQEKMNMKLIPSEEGGYDTALSGCIIECAKPLIATLAEMLHENGMPEEWVDEQVKELLYKAAILWNFCFFPYEEAIEKVLNSSVSPFCIVGIPEKEAEPIKNLAKIIFEMIYACKSKMFPDDTRFVVNASVYKLDDELRLSVASQELEVNPDLLNVFDD